MLQERSTHANIWYWNHRQLYRERLTEEIHCRAQTQSQVNNCNSQPSLSFSLSSCLRSVQFEEFGMPSSHSQFTWFCSGYLILFTLFRLTNTTTWKSLTVVACLGTGLLMSYSRVYLQYHTVAQVVWGAVVGLAGSLLWFILTQLVLSPLYPRYSIDPPPSPNVSATDSISVLRIFSHLF